MAISSSLSDKAEHEEIWFLFNVQAFGSPHPERIVNINYDGFAEDVKVGDQFLVDGGTMSSK